MIALVILLALIGGLIILVNPFAGLLAIVVLIPQGLIPAVFHMFLGAFTAATPIKIIGGLTFVSAFFHQVAKGKKWGFLKEPTVVFYGLFLIYVFINGFWMPSSFTRENFTFFVAIAVFGFLIFTQVTTPKRLRLVIWAFLISVFVISINSIINFMVFGSVTARARGAAFDPNYFAISLLPFIAISFFNAGAEKSKFLKFVSFFFTLTFMVALVATQSRGGFVGFAAMLLMALFAAKRKFVALLVVLVSSVFVISIMPQNVWERFEKTRLEAETIEEQYDEAIGSTLRRYYLAKAAWEIFLEDPVFGIGLGNYYWECPLYYPIYPGRAHNMYLEIMAEMGVVGILLFLGIMISFLKCLKRLKGSDPPLNILAKGIFIGHMGFFTAALFLHAQQDKGFWMIIFLAVAMERIWRNQGQDRAKPAQPAPVKSGSPEIEPPKPRKPKMWRM